MRTLTINYGPGVDGEPNLHGYEVINDYGQTTGLLCYGEMLEQVAEMVHPKLGGMRYAMLTPNEWAQRWARRQERLKAPVSPAPELLTEDPDHGDV